ncbi:transcription initiation protein [Brachybacterium vulturis]|uniref:Transcription initiation protein n=1 Tax=Brachybacterium vulturis TaxID=2017484 RepID=A0A291GPK3_9MICO|nr:YciI family protein [Brachybacterium vulturis]ATG51916.1 transcription initiation protein [Brachybacterium vulturis]
MATYLISFPSRAMRVQEPDLQEVADDSHAVVREAKAAGAWIFGGGIDESVPPVMVDGTGGVLESTYAETRHLGGGFAVLEVATREEALEWARKLAAACRCAQEVRVFGDDPES